MNAVRLAKIADMKAASEAVEAQKQAMSETADAFRGVHLDPNAHHWDEVSVVSSFLNITSNNRGLDGRG